MNARPSSVVLYVIFIMASLNLYEMINNVRNVCAFALISFAVFREMYLKKRDPLTFALYIIPLFLHTSAVLFIFIRLVAKYIGKMKLLLFILVSNVMLLLDLAYAVVTRIGSGNIVVSLVRNLVIKGHFYFHNTTSDWGKVVSNSLTYKIERFANITFAFIVCYLIYYIGKKKLSAADGSLYALLPWEKRSGKPGQFEAWNNYCFLLALATIACLPMVMPEYWRFFSITVICSALPFLILIENGRHVVRYRGYLIYLVSPLCLLITLRYILYSDRLKLILGPFMSSPLLVLGKGILHLLR